MPLSLPAAILQQHSRISALSVRSPPHLLSKIISSHPSAPLLPPPSAHSNLDAKILKDLLSAFAIRVLNSGQEIAKVNPKKRFMKKISAQESMGVTNKEVRNRGISKTIARKGVPY